MSFNWETLARLHEKTDGRCHLCGSDLELVDYSEAWEVDHSNPKSLGGTNHLNNLFAACVPCNRGKGNRNSRSFRSVNGLNRAPISRNQRARKQTRNVAMCATGAGLIGRAIHPKGFWPGVFLGSILGLVITE